MTAWMFDSQPTPTWHCLLSPHEAQEDVFSRVLRAIPVCISEPLVDYWYVNTVIRIEFSISVVM